MQNLACLFFFFNLVQECRAAACLTLLKLQNSWENVCVVAPASTVCLYHTHTYIYTHIFVIHTYIYTRIECVCESVCMCVCVCVCACEREKEKGNFRERLRVHTLSHTHRVHVWITWAREIKKKLKFVTPVHSWECPLWKRGVSGSIWCYYMKYEVATISRLLKIIGLFCKRAL